jgi:hypothetical protein
MVWTKGDALSKLIFHFALQYTISIGLENQAELKANMIHSFRSMLMMLIDWAQTWQPQKTEKMYYS